MQIILYISFIKGVLVLTSHFLLFFIKINYSKITSNLMFTVIEENGIVEIII